MEFHYYNIFENDLDFSDVIDYGFPRMNYTRYNHFHELDEFHFYQRFRLKKQTTL